MFLESKPTVSLNVPHSRFVWLAPPDLSWWNLFKGLPHRWFGNFCFPGEGLCQLVPLTVETESDSWVVVMAHGGKHSPRWGRRQRYQLPEGGDWGPEERRQGPELLLWWMGWVGRVLSPSPEELQSPPRAEDLHLSWWRLLPRIVKKHGVSVWGLSFNFLGNWDKVPLGQI